MADWRNKLYFGDNLGILREHMPGESVDLTYIDPPFNSNATYDVLFKEASGEGSAARIQAFDDTRHWKIAAALPGAWNRRPGHPGRPHQAPVDWNEDMGFAQHELALYKDALDRARDVGDRGQTYYHAINVAFLEFVAFDRIERAREMAALALENAAHDEANAWSLATQAEAHLYIGRPDLALDLYRRALGFGVELWERVSMALQAGQIASKLKDAQLADKLEEIFAPAARKSNRIFVSYSHEDREWKDRFCQMLAPFLRDGDIELHLWSDDQRIRHGEGQHDAIQRALETAGVAVVLVSASFLDSEDVVKHELPRVVSAAADGKIRLFWAYVSHAAYDATELEPFRAAHDVSQPLYAMGRPEQDATLLSVARDIKAAALGATDRFREMPVNSCTFETGLAD